MTPVLEFLLTLLTLEGLLLVLRPAHVKAFLSDSPDKMLRVVGIAELIIVIVIVILVCRIL